MARPDASEGQGVVPVDESQATELDKLILAKGMIMILMPKGREYCERYLRDHPELTLSPNGADPPADE